MNASKRQQISGGSGDTAHTLCEQQRRKRVRKGTKSCWECKRRKTRCQYAVETDPACSGCLDRGTQCISQEFEDDVGSNGTGASQLGVRMGRVERLLERLMEKMDRGDRGNRARSDSSGHDDIGNERDSCETDLLTPESLPTNSAHDVAPIMSLFDNSVFSRQENHLTHSSQTQISTVASEKSTPSAKVARRGESKIDRTRRQLIAVMPARRDIDTITSSTNGWDLIKKLVLNNQFGHDLEATVFTELFHLDLTLDLHPTTLARSLLALLLCIQQLSHDFDETRLTCSSSLEEISTKIARLVTTLVLLDDDLIGTLDGIDALVLSSVEHMNAGRLQKCWLLMRRALNVAQFKGLHRAKSLRNLNENSILRAKFLWYRIVKSERYIALLVGISSGIPATQPIIQDDDCSYLTDVDLLWCKLSDLACQIIDRNESGAVRAYSVTQDIDEQLEQLVKSKPAAWWLIRDPQDVMTRDDAESYLHILLVQMWHNQLEALLHLPFMIRAATERRYEYSKVCCLKATRELIQRWLFLRAESFAYFMCTILDFQVFTGCVTLLLAVFSPRQKSASVEDIEQDRQDRALIDTVIRYMQRTQSLGKKDLALKQSIDVLKTLNSINPNTPIDARASLKLTIPHFGTVVLGNESCPSGSAVATAAHPPVVSGNKGLAMGATEQWQDTSTMPIPNAESWSCPQLAFASSQFPAIWPDMYDLTNWDHSMANVVNFDEFFDQDVEATCQF